MFPTLSPLRSERQLAASFMNAVLRLLALADQWYDDGTVDERMTRLIGSRDHITDEDVPQVFGFLTHQVDQSRGGAEASLVWYYVPTEGSQFQLSIESCTPFMGRAQPVRQTFRFDLETDPGLLWEEEAAVRVAKVIRGHLTDLETTPLEFLPEGFTLLS